MIKNSQGESYSMSHTQTNSFYNAPPLMGQNTQATKFKNQSNRPLGSQERLMNAHQTTQYAGQSFKQGKRPPHMNTTAVTQYKSGSTDNLNSPMNLHSHTEPITTNVSSHHVQVTSPQMIQGKVKSGSGSGQFQHFIKVKSKTKANPTRQNSPRYSNQYPVAQKNMMRESVSSQNKKQQ